MFILCNLDFKFKLRKLPVASGYHFGPHNYIGWQTTLVWNFINAKSYFSKMVNFILQTDSTVLKLLVIPFVKEHKMFLSGGKSSATLPKILLYKHCKVSRRWNRNCRDLVNLIEIMVLMMKYLIISVNILWKQKNIFLSLYGMKL
jgi:hypothetical protein